MQLHKGASTIYSGGAILTEGWSVKHPPSENYIVYVGQKLLFIHIY